MKTRISEIARTLIGAALGVSRPNSAPTEAPVPATAVEQARSGATAQPWLAGLGQGNVIVADSILDDARNHLEFLGFSVETRGTMLVCRRKGALVWLVRDFNGGLLLSTIFGASDAAREDPVALIAVANQINRQAATVRAYCDGEVDLCFDVWHPNVYEKATFGAFFERLNGEVEAHMRQMNEALKGLLK